MIFIITFVLVCLTTVQSIPAPATRRCLPRQWEATAFGKLSQILHGQGEIGEVMSTFSADYSRRMDVLVLSAFTNDEFVSNFTILRTMRAVFFISSRNQTCSILAAPLTFKPSKRICTDTPGLKYLDSWTLGGKIVDAYTLTEAIGVFGMQIGYKQTLAVFRDTFLPVTVIKEPLSMPRGQTRTVQFIQYGNVTTGIRDPSIFDIPSYCLD